MTSSYALRYAPAVRPLLTAFGMGAGLSGVQIGGGELSVRMGWAFRARIPLDNVTAAEPATMPLLGGWGVHGWDGRWLVNGSAAGIVRLRIDPPVRAYAVGVPIRLRMLLISLVDPQGFLAGLPLATAG